MDTDLLVFPCQIPDETAMLTLGRLLAQCIRSGCLPTSPHFTIYLHGHLGAGKTTLTRGFLRGMNYMQTVKSPTYTLVESYLCQEIWVHHFDLYRVQHEAELEFIGLQEYFSNDTICLIEWPGHAAHVLPAPDLVIDINIDMNNQIENTRKVVIHAKTIRGKEVLDSFVGIDGL